ncbi:MAG: hypothetical protein K9N51_10985 [Candidatus Pacebacteria bacterium]|nr:hypothetical protein [Candidatus Paceibacterota bacterium]
MEPDGAIEIVQSLADGVDPYSGERFASDSPFQQADTDATGALLRSYTWGSGIDNLLAITVHGATETNTYYAITDHLGTVRALTDDTGAVAEAYRYDAWGNVLGVFDGNGQTLLGSALGNRFLFHGREYSSTTGLYNFRARWYDPTTGRWLSKDPIGISGGLNQYVFCGNNPVNFVDPLGLDFVHIVDADAVKGQGHAAVITGPVNGQWRYDSFGKLKGSHRHGQYSFTSEQDALNFARQHGYTHFARWQTSPAQDAAAQARADQWHTGAGQNYTTRRQYEVDGDNCQAMVDDAADAANLETYYPRAGIRHPNITMRYTRQGADEYGPLR